MKLYKVGGWVRDNFLSIPSKDIDYAVECDSWETMLEWANANCEKVFLVKPEFLTIRALWKGEAVDFVMCRKDGTYSDQRRPDSVTPGTIYDDLARRDFTMNAMAIDCDTGKLIDPHNGQKDLRNKLLACVGDTDQRLREDPLRILRAFRFMITKDLFPSWEIRAYWEFPGLANLIDTVSKERVREELHKCFVHNTDTTLASLGTLHALRKACFQNTDIWLKPTMEKQ